MKKFSTRKERKPRPRVEDVQDGYTHVAKTWEFYPKAVNKFGGRKYTRSDRVATVRSSWEEVVFRYLEACPEVVCWVSETMRVEYYDPVKTIRRDYYPDVYFEMENEVPGKDNKCFLVEVKPSRMLRKPKEQYDWTDGKKRTEEYKSWQTLRAKHYAAKELAERKGWQFQVWTERKIDWILNNFPQCAATSRIERD